MRKMLSLAGAAGMLLALTVGGAAQAAGTTGDTNATPLISTTVVINEVQTNGLNQNDQFVELRNVSPNSLSLEGYQLLRCDASGNEIVIHTFEQGTVLQPYGQVGQYLLIAPSAVRGVAPDVTVAPNIARLGGAILRTPFEQGSMKVDSVGFSTSAGTCVEQRNVAGAAPSLPAYNTFNKSVQRNQSSTDTDTNSVDFGLLIRSPQNSTSI